jgi:hypothetical protein
MCLESQVGQRGTGAVTAVGRRGRYPTRIGPSRLSDLFGPRCTAAGARYILGIVSDLSSQTLQEPALAGVGCVEGRC